ncbi:hypothetical protein UT300018_11840 [Clostridium faecium]|uniref:SPASM domain-containing protein n=1 Tax=Clostridium faecium TaxID=2762223 RepID=A0ABR8YQB5_9CLOT|nr:SPASM domain-containing protein [Clostridium faecium]MBD8046401.1 SPASM domain-containing protein [Clostridium faecium]
MEKIIFTKFEYQNIQDSLIDKRNKKIFNYLIENGIVSKVPHAIRNPLCDDIRQLYYISLQVTERCNLRCKHCYASAGEALYDNELSTNQLKEIIEKASSFSKTKECNLLISEELKLGNIREKSFKDIWLYSDLKKTLGDLTVDEFENCKNCEIRYFCGGGCRGTAFNSSGNIMSSPPNCQEKKKTIYSYLWDFADKDNLFDLLRKV